MLQLVEDHPLMKISLLQKEKELIDQLSDIPVDQKESKIVLLFTGGPVKGSIGIDTNFAGKVIVPFQNMVSSEVAHRIHGHVGKRGQLNSRAESRLFLTALPRGSFGIELSKLESADLFEDGIMSDSLSHITKLIDSSAKSDEDFAAELDDITPRTIKGLQDFLKIISDDDAGVRIESGGINCELDIAKVKTAFERVAGTQTRDELVSVNGIFKGILLESWKFDFLSENEEVITGKISEDLTEADVSKYMEEKFNRHCSAAFKKEIVIFKNGREKLSYTLKSLS